MFRYAAVLLFSSVALAQQPTVPAPGSGSAGVAAHGPAFKAKKLNRAELDSYLAHPDQVLLIDVRRPDEISSIGGFSVYLSIQIKDLKDRLSAIPKDRILITVSNHAARAGLAADLLAENGFKVAGAVGAQLYEAEGGTLFKIRAPKQDADADAKTTAGAGKGR